MNSSPKELDVPKHSSIRTALLWVSATLLVAFSLFLILGSPLPYPNRYPGFFLRSDLVRELILMIVRSWNWYLPTFLKPVQLTYVTDFAVTLFLWLAVATSLITSLCFLGLRKRRSRKLLNVPVPPSGIHLGQDEAGKAYLLTEGNLGYHVEIVAPSGSGKTVLLQNIIRQRIAQGHGILFIDLKAELSLVEWVYGATISCNRASDFRLISLANEELSVPYNPIKFGSAHEIHSQIMNSLTWSEDFYRKVASMALQTVVSALCDYRDTFNRQFHLGHVLSLLHDPNALESFLSILTQSNLLESASNIERLAAQLDRGSERDKLMGLIAGLSALIHSSAGNLLTSLTAEKSYDLNEAINQGRVTYFSINSLKLRESASVFAKLLLQDLMRFVGDRYSKSSETKYRPVTVVIDEFASFAIPEFIELLDRARGAGIGIILAHQSRADLRAISPEFQDRVEANSNTTIVSGVKSSEDADYYAGIIGTQTIIKKTVQKESLLGFWDTDTGMRSTREAEEYVLHPNRIKALSQGKVLVISRTVAPNWGLVSVPMAPKFPHTELPKPSSVPLPTNSLLSLSAPRAPTQSTEIGPPSVWNDLIGS
jgi:type IV secretory pathway TraG/TraD family ATPase VirD4